MVEVGVLLGRVPHLRMLGGYCGGRWLVRGSPVFLRPLPSHFGEKLWNAVQTLNPAQPASEYHQPTSGFLPPLVVLAVMNLCWFPPLFVSACTAGPINKLLAVSDVKCFLCCINTAIAQ